MRAFQRIPRTADSSTVRLGLRDIAPHHHSRRERSVDWPRAGSCRDLSQRRDRRDFIEADFQALPGGASALRHSQHSPLSVQRSHRRSDATAAKFDAASSMAEKSRHPANSWPRAVSYFVSPDPVLGPQEQPHGGHSNQIRVVHHGCLPAIGVRYDLHSGSFGTIQLGSSAYHENRLRGQASLHIDEASGSE
jgi:hypothetical protein